jgi:hypothetical protein
MIVVVVLCGDDNHDYDHQGDCHDMMHSYSAITNLRKLVTLRSDVFYKRRLNSCKR